jgi:hypothetical protein
VCSIWWASRVSSRRRQSIQYDGLPYPQVVFILNSAHTLSASVIEKCKLLTIRWMRIDRRLFVLEKIRTPRFFVSWKLDSDRLNVNV